jgi:hypothetical protein
VLGRAICRLFLELPYLPELWTTAASAAGVKRGMQQGIAPLQRRSWRHFLISSTRCLDVSQPTTYPSRQALPTRNITSNTPGAA